MPNSNFDSFTANIKSVFFLSLTLILFTIICIQISPAQMVRNTEYQADKSLKSNARVNPSTLAMEFSIPLAGYRGRAGNGLPVAFSYSSKVWQIKAMSSFENHHGTITDTRPMYGKRSAGGWTSNLGSPRIDFQPVRYTGYRENQPYHGLPYEPVLWGDAPPNENLYHIKRIHVIMPDGGTHEMRVDDTIRDCGTMQWQCNPDMLGTYLAVDGSRMRLEVTSQNSVLLMPDGSRYLFGQDDYTATTLIDPQGNRMTYDIAQQRWTDTLGRVINDPLPSNWEDFQQTQVVGDQTASFPGIGSGTLNAILSWRYLKDPAGGESGLENVSDTLHSLSNTGCNGNTISTVTGPHLFTSYGVHLARVCQTGSGTLGNWTQSPPFNPIVLTKITLANGQFYQFKYNVYGEITKIIYPTGTYERFAYAWIPSLQGNEDTYAQANRGVTNRWVSVTGDGTDEMPWTYQAVFSNTYKVKITAPDGSWTEQYLYTEPIAPPQAYGFSRERTGRSYEDRVYSTANRLLRRSLTKYVTTGPQPGGYWGATRDLRVEKQVSIIFEPGESYALAQLSETAYDTNSDPQYFAELNANQSKIYKYKVIDLTTAQSADIDTLVSMFSGADLEAVTEVDYLYDVNYKAGNITGLAMETRVRDGNGNIRAKSQIAYDEPGYGILSSGVTTGWVDPNTNYRGNPTTTRSWTDISTNQYVESHAQYDNFGNLRKAWDAKGNVSEIEYSAIYKYAYPTKTISTAPGGNGSPTPFETTSIYDFNTGLVTSVTDANGQTSTMEYNDPLLRPTKAVAPNGHQTITEYGVGTSEATRFVKVRSQIDDNKWSEGYQWFDGLGRTVRTQSVDTDGDIFALTCYDRYGRMSKASNPFRNVPNPTCSSNLEWTTNVYDEAGRVKETITLDGAKVQTAYSLATTGNNIGTVVTVTDQANKQRRSITNGLGQLKRVDEPTSAGLGMVNSPNQATYYDYDTLNNLTTVNQGQQTRTFAYDSASRLTSATNPESGTISYNYDLNGNLTSKTDARNITTSYAYDNLNRVITRSYGNEPTGQTATPNVTYYYDNLPNAKGQLIKVSSSVSTTEYQAFDIMGRLTQSQQTTSGTAYNPMTYAYNLSGAMIEQTYPSGRKVKNVLDNDGQLAMVQSKKNVNAGYFNYAKSFTYTAHGAVESMQLGNGKWESTNFNERLQPTRIALGTVQGGFDKLKLDYTYGTTNNNGNVLTQTITVANTATATGFEAIQTYNYDELNRLKSAEEKIANATSWKQTYTFDRYGNRRFDTTGNNTTTLDSGCTTAVCNPTIDPATNKLIGYTFDTAGNTKVDATGKTFTYDAENKQTKVVSGSNVIGEYFYDGDGKRVKKKVNGEETIFVYNASGQLVAEYTNQTPQNAPKVSYLTSDHLGSPRITTDVDGKVYTRRDFMPFGEDIDVDDTSQRSAGLNYASDEIKQKFTTYERDNETDLDFAQARYYNKDHGRFTTVDPVLMMADRQIDPQQVNLYAYCRNNPLAFVDPSGMILDPTTWKKDARKAYEKYVDFLNKDAKKYASELATLEQLKKSDVNYVVRLDQSGSNFGSGTEGGVTTDGKDVFINLANQGNSKEQISLNATFGHELEHARQFDSGEFGFRSDKNGNFVDKKGNFVGGFEAVDITDEVKAWSVTAKLATSTDFMVKGGHNDPEFQFPILDEFNKSTNKGGILAKISDNYNGMNTRETNVPRVNGKPIGTLVRPTLVDRSSGDKLKGFWVNR